MNKYFIRRLFGLGMLILLTTYAFGLPADSIPKRHWALPHHVKAQFAGGIGFVSIGAGYSNRKQKLEGDLFYGYVPKSVGSVAIHTLTGKGSWWPLKPIILNGFEIKPLGTGLLINYTFGEQYFAFSPPNYRFNYYKYPTSLHAGLHLGSLIQTPLKKQGRVKQWAFYGEVVTYDVEVVAFFVNRRTLGPGDILSLGFGLKAKL